MTEAACKDTDDPDAFFAVRGQSRRRLKALQICASCPVVDECSSYQKRTNVKHGIWGGKLQTRKSED